MKQIGTIKSYKFSLETLSPIFIGGADDNNLSNLNYYYDIHSKNLYIIDENKFSNYLRQTKKIDDFENFVLTNKNAKLFNWFRQNNIDGAKLDIYKKSQNLGRIDIKNLNDIKMFIKNVYGEPYIPGSSIKGAIRQAILSHIILNNKERFSKYWSLIQQELHEQRPKFNRIINEIEAEAFSMGQFKNIQIDSIMRGLEVSDSSFLAEKDLHIAQKVDFNIEKQHDSKPHSLPIWREYLNAYTKAKFTITIDSSIFPYSIDELYKILNEFVTYQDKLISNVLKNTEEVFLPLDLDEKIIPNLCIGGGSGFIIKSIIYQLAPSYDEARKCVAKILDKAFYSRKKHAPQHNHELEDRHISPRTYKVVKEDYDYLPIGWCYISEDK